MMERNRLWFRTQRLAICWGGTLGLWWMTLAERILVVRIGKLVFSYYMRRKKS
jgi:hypothetical protein